MALRAHISERQRRFGIELRRLRLAAGLAVQDAAAHINMRGPQLNHIEAARTGLDEIRLRALAAAYGCTDETHLDLLVAMGASDGKGWWSAYKRKVPDFALDLAELEGGGLSQYLSYQTFFMPGLLQTEEYIRRLFENGETSLPSEQIENSVRFRLDRQAILTDSNQTKFSFVIHEAALLMSFAGPGAMHRQLAHLLHLWELPNIEIQIYPFSVQATPPYSGPFMMTDPGSRELSTVVIDHPGASEFTDSPEVLEKYRSRFADLSRLALQSGSAQISTQPNSTRDSWAVVQHVKHSLEMGR
ncbi:transcriptional regulator with XRE-family HTH domain [Kitasatospora sp. MAA4]|uniref:helix-turn-helix domain-containing protein n=1 Tax=Kitasatospora sp. MAA4 TaxID=3035093 RepID=UPI002476CF2B|nr:helix-turn-helix transcriptional regulator [Kitasatospora sp. MAA4]MDH6133137.1 transcriptional regulator with XRE-family HTH domain [Kitasatospora sp. MAA4]